MQPERPVQLTFPAYDVGAARIDADGRQVGHVLADDVRQWHARLWPRPDMRPFTMADLEAMETVICPTLREVRAVLRERVAEKGPWWTG
jgi:hypothetical protein